MFVGLRGQRGYPAVLRRNGYVESFNGKVRDECLNINLFSSLAHARVVISDWKTEYNQHRRHSALGYRTPAAYAEGCQRAAPGRPKQRLVKSDWGLGR